MVSCTGPILLATYQVDGHKDQHDNDNNLLLPEAEKQEEKKEHHINGFT